jgi:hypothetical protein
MRCSRSARDASNTRAIAVRAQRIASPKFTDEHRRSSSTRPARDPSANRAQPTRRAGMVWKQGAANETGRLRGRSSNPRGCALQCDSDSISSA